MRKILYSSFLLLLLATMIGVSAQAYETQKESPPTVEQLITVDVTSETITVNSSFVEIEVSPIILDYDFSQEVESLNTTSPPDAKTLIFTNYYDSTENLCQLLLIPLNSHWNSKMLYS